VASHVFAVVFDYQTYSLSDWVDARPRPRSASCCNFMAVLWQPKAGTGPGGLSVGGGTGWCWSERASIGNKQADISRRVWSPP